ncbi:hypothetical protein SAMN04490206_3195 [Pseudomonas umsongensis]|nr:hypothetical protein SAMN04490206_3195 [Pseudomonas umsongensis]
MLGMPSLRSCSVGPPRSTIHGRARLTRHPCRVAHYAEPPLGLSMGQENQKPKQSKSKARRPDSRPDCRTVRNPIVGAGLLAKDVQTTQSSRQGALSLTFFASKPAPTGDWGYLQKSGRLSGRLAFVFDLGAPLTTMAERRHCAVGKPAGRRFSRAGRSVITCTSSAVQPSRVSCSRSGDQQSGGVALAHVDLPLPESSKPKHQLRLALNNLH